MTESLHADMTAVETAWLLLVISLPTASGTARMRIWRALKSLGCVALRDGAYLLPAAPESRKALRDLGEEARGDRQVEDALGPSQALVVALESLGQVLEQLRVSEVTLNDPQPRLERPPDIPNLLGIKHPSSSALLRLRARHALDDGRIEFY